MKRTYVVVALAALLLSALGCGTSGSAADVHATAGIRAFDDEDYERAASELELAVQGPLENHEEKEIYYLLGRSYDSLDEFDSAIAAYQDALEIDPEYVDAWVGLGIVYRLAGDLDSAEAAYQEALRIDPNSAQARSSLGALYVFQGEIDKAIEELELAIDLDPQLATTHSNLALAYAIVGRFEEAEAALRQATALGYENSRIIQERIDELKALDGD